MHRDIFPQPKIPSRPLLKLACRIGHVKSAATIADWQTIREHVLAKLDRHVGVERIDQAVAKDVAGDDVGMPGTKDQLAVGMNSGPVKRHEATLVTEGVEIVGEVGLIIGATQLARRRKNKRT